jgi:hypothetical protein
MGKRVLPAVEIRSGFYHFRTRFRAGKSHGACVDTNSGLSLKIATAARDARPF